LNTSIDIDTPQADPVFETGRGHGHKTRERKDIASGDIMPPAQMIRLAFSPQGDVVADIYGKLPGRGAWIAANRDAVATALKSKAFARAAKRKVTVPDDFSDLIEAGLKTRISGLLGMARRAGALESGFDNVFGAGRIGQLAFRFEASDGSEDGRGKIRASAKGAAKELDQAAPPVVGVFSAAELGAVLGREHMVHIGVRTGKLAKALHLELSRLAGFCPLIPDAWPDTEHEPEFVPIWGREN